MPDRKTHVIVNPESGDIKAVMPAQPPASAPTDTRVTLTPGTSEHEALVEDVPRTDTEAPTLERRRAQTPVSVNVQQPIAAGLTGIRGQIANMGGVAFVFLMAFLMYRDLQSNQKEFMTIVREERKEDRTEAQAANAAMVVALSGLTASNNAMVSEMRQARQEMSALVKVLTSKMAPDEVHGFAPMPRVRGDAGGSE